MRRPSPAESGDDTAGPSSGEDRFGEYQIEGPGDLESLLVSWDRRHGHTTSLHEPGIIRHVIDLRLGMGLLENRPLEALRGLHRAEDGSIGGGHHSAISIDGLDGVDHSQHRDDCVLARSDGRNDTFDHLNRHQGARGIMHEDHVHILRQRQEGTRDRGLPGVSSGDDDEFGILNHSAEQGADGIDICFRGSDDDRIYAPGEGQRAHSVYEDGGTPEGAEGLWGAGPETLTSACGGHQCGGAAHWRRMGSA